MDVQREEFEWSGAGDALRRLHMPHNGRRQWMTIMAALERASVAEWGKGIGGLYWYASRELYGSEYKWRAYTTDNLTEVTLAWPKS